MTRSPASSPTRSAYFDNAKAVLICLVVFGHVLELGLSNDALFGPIYKFIYTFHMPAFVFVSGYFSTKDRFSASWAQEIIGLLAVFVTFQGLYALFSAIALGTPWTFDGLLTRPYWLMWYLLSLIWWKLSLPLVSRTRFTIPMAVLGAIMAGAFIADGSWLSLMRTFYFWPFFLAGYALRSKGMVTNGQPRLAIVATILLGLVFAAFLMGWRLDNGWLYGRTFADLQNPPHAIATRIALFFLSLSTTIAFFILVPRGEYFWSPLGKYTLSIFLLHGFIVRGADVAGLSLTATPLLAPLMTIAIVAVCSLPQFDRGIRRIQETAAALANKGLSRGTGT